MRPGIPSPPAFFFSCLLVMEALHILGPGPRLLSGPWSWMGWVPVVLGIWLHSAGYALFRRRETTLATLETPRLLVTDGPFRFSRNPMYASGLLILGGLGIVLGTTTPLLVPLAFLLLVLRWYVLPEEALLLREFGEEYGEYRSRVRRWL